MDKDDQQSSGGFYGLSIAPGLLRILDKLGFVTPTPIQRQAIPAALEGKDVVGVAQTGTGKTLAFAIPMIQRIAQTKGMGLVLLPTRELALQVDEDIAALGRSLGSRTAVIIGGMSARRQITALSKKPHVIIATPGRLIDLLNQRAVSLSRVNTLVLDEADRMLDMGFLPQIKKILDAVPRERQTMLFSATLSKDIMTIASDHMERPLRIEVAPPGTTADRVTQEIYFVDRREKLQLLEKLLGDHSGSVLVFMRTKYGAKRVARSVRAMGHSAAEIHSNRSLGQRRDALDGFKSGKYRVLVATDIAARGLDVADIEVVINFDLPSQAEDYVHRIGRTARAGASGRAISFAMPDQRSEIRTIERLVKKTLPRSPLPDLPPPRKPPRRPDSGSHKGSHRSSGSGSAHRSRKKPSSRGGRGRRGGHSGGRR